MIPNMPLPDLLDAVRRNANLPADQAEATPPQVYTSPEFLELELTQIFNREWICVGREDEFANPGDYRVTRISRDEVVILRDRDGNLRAISNICRHRMMSLLEGDGNLAGKITCPYHAWTYTLDGQLIGASHMRENFDKSTCRLPQYPGRGLAGLCLCQSGPRRRTIGPAPCPAGRTVHELSGGELSNAFPRKRGLGYELENPLSELHGALPPIRRPHRTRWSRSCPPNMPMW